MSGDGRPGEVLKQMPAGLDPDAWAWVTGQALPGRRIVHTERLAGGYRNDNLLLATDAGERLVLRRYLHTNACAVEAALAGRLAGSVPVAEVVAADPTGEAAGQPLLLSRFVPGVLASTTLRTVTKVEAGALGRAIGHTLARIGETELARPGFFTGADLEPDPPGMEPAADLPAFVERCLRTGPAEAALTPAELDAVRRLAAGSDPDLAPARGARQLVHADFNPKNLLVTRCDDGWAVAAVLDWEFAFSSSPLVDIGNMLRFADERPPAFTRGFLAGYEAGGGHLPDGWRRTSLALDLFSLADFLTRPPDHHYFRRAVALLRRRTAELP
ncbi:MAG TPA: phosphotransferase [Micromonosporaceae bacterium]|nr:phosphotransferase [Micromonosporaceae bacterium]